jgi:hypothetical protein
MQGEKTRTSTDCHKHLELINTGRSMLSSGVSGLTATVAIPGYRAAVGEY